MNHRSHVVRAELFERGLGRWLWCSGPSDVCFEPNKMIKYSALPKFTAACWYCRYKVHMVHTAFLRLNIIHDMCPCDVVWEEKCRIFFNICWFSGWSLITLRYQNIIYYHHHHIIISWTLCLRWHRPLLLKHFLRAKLLFISRRDRNWILLKVPILFFFPVFTARLRQRHHSCRGSDPRKAADCGQRGGLSLRGVWARYVHTTR